MVYPSWRSSTSFYQSHLDQCFSSFSFLFYLCWRFLMDMPLCKRASLVTQLVKNPPAMWETWVQSLGWEGSLEKEMATHSSVLAWRIPWTVQSMGSQIVGHNWVTFLFTFTFHCAGVLKPGGKWAYIYIFSVISRVNNLTQTFLTETTEAFLQWIINSMWVTWNSHPTLCPASSISSFSFLSFLELASLPFGCSHSGRGKKIF